MSEYTHYRLEGLRLMITDLSKFGYFVNGDFLD